MPPPTTADLTTALLTYLTSKHLPPQPQFLTSLLPSLNPSIPLAATQKTALFRLLATDITSTLQSTPTSTFPPNIHHPAVKETTLPGPITVQVLDIEDLGRSAWSQVEMMEMEERGEFRKGSEIIRVTEEEETSDPAARPAASGPHKLLVQDAKGVKVFAFEMESVTGVGMGMAIGSKMVLKGVVVARGVVLLTPGSVEVLGGKVEMWERKWREERKARLKVRAGGGEGGG
ncbi:RecQ mediated genome instability protein Rmi1 [Zymoseptoria brevis]|uniref:RecQ-mediated genome instability protein 1 n=1 Tax=Zymoseptoria brevis TaxID=1047168 RepID=A0A0F4G467_9PEZI|nr:RecQ mediated genome instability protein Rmi1 [Zymoseptoria brevis]